MTTDIDELTQDFLAHHGVKGMKWGVVKDDISGAASNAATTVKTTTTNTVARVNSSNVVKSTRDAANTVSDRIQDRKDNPLLTDHQKQVAKNVAIGVGVIAAVAGTAYIGYQLNQSGHLSLPSLAKNGSTAAKGAKKVAELLKEPTDVIHATRGKNHGFTFPATGNTKNYLEVLEREFGADAAGGNTFKKTANGIAAAFDDPHGRRDFAGRKIPHQVFIPKNMTEGINNVDDVITKIYPRLRSAAEALDNIPDSARR